MNSEQCFRSFSNAKLSKCARVQNASLSPVRLEPASSQLSVSRWTREVREIVASLAYSRRRKFACL
jgi:hypothetical protein